MSNALLATNALISLLDRAAVVGAVLQKAAAEGRDVTDAEIDASVGRDDAAKAALAAEIAKARAVG